MARRPANDPKNDPKNDNDNPAFGPEGEALVLMTKGGEESYVNPSCVASHKEAGWKIAE